MNAEKYTTDDLKISGIHLVSRYCRQCEMDQMIAFIIMLSSKIPSLQWAQIKSVYYDSQSQTAVIDFHNGKNSNDDLMQFLPPPILDAILDAARETINQFEWDGLIEHGFEDLEEAGGEI